MPPALAFNGTVLQSEHVLPAPRPSFGQVQDTALQPDAIANMGHQPQPQSQSHSQPHYLRTSSSFSHAASVNSVDHFTFPSTSQHLEHSSFMNTSEFSPAGRHSLSDGIPPAFETSSSCAASAALLSRTPGRQFSIPHLATGKLSYLVSNRRHHCYSGHISCLVLHAGFLAQPRWYTSTCTC